MSYEYESVPVVAYRDPDSGRLMVSALLDGVEVNLAAHKLGHFGGQLDDAKQAKQESSSSDQPPAPPQ